MLPFLKNRDDGVGVGPVEVKERKPDEDKEFGTLDAVAHDLLAAIESKDVRYLKEVLSALCDHIQDMDSEQDQNLMGE